MGSIISKFGSQVLCGEPLDPPIWPSDVPEAVSEFWLQTECPAITKNPNSPLTMTVPQDVDDWWLATGNAFFAAKSLSHLPSLIPEASTAPPPNTGPPVLPSTHSNTATATSNPPADSFSPSLTPTSSSTSPTTTPATPTPTANNLPPLSSPAPASTSSALNSDAQSRKTVATGMIIGIVVAILAIIAVLLLLLFLLLRRKQRTRRLSETGVMIETSGPMVRSSLSLTAHQVDPFVTPSSSDTSLSSLAQRQQYITNEMRLVRKRMEDLQHKGDISTSSSDSLVPESSALSPSQALTHDTNALDLERSRQEINTLQSRIAELEEQLQSAWALGLSNEPPPGYVA